MDNEFAKISDTATWQILVTAAKKALEEQGYSLERVPGRGRSNVWNAEYNGEQKLISIRTTKDRWFAFPPLDNGEHWKTLDDVDSVVVAAVDDRERPRSIEVYQFNAQEVRERFDESYSVRIKEGYTVKDNFGMWVNLDKDDRGIPASVGSGIAEEHTPIAVYSIGDLTAQSERIDREIGVADDSFNGQPGTISEVLNMARHRIASLSGVRVDAVKLDCRIET